MKHEGSCLRAMRRFLDGDNRYARDGKWTVANGGYDLWWCVSYDGLPVIECVDGEVQAIVREYDAFARRIVDKLNYHN